MATKRRANIYGAASAGALVPSPPQGHGGSPHSRRLGGYAQRYAKYATVPSRQDRTHGGFPIAIPSAVSTSFL